MRKVWIFVVLLAATSFICNISGAEARGISGHVTDLSGNGIANVSVDLFNADDILITGSTTDDNGYYALSVPAGTYKIRFTPHPSSGYYAPQWYANKANSVIADLVTVKGFRSISNVNAQLEIGGKISGRVTDASGDAIANVYVDAFDLYGHWLPGSSTDNNGNYSFNMPAGTYKVHFNPSPSSGYNAPAWYDNKANVQLANLVTVSAQVTSIIDAQLEIGGTISGQVTGTAGKAIRNVHAEAYDSELNWMGGTSTDVNGKYSFNVSVGIYKLTFSPFPSSGYYAPEWYHSKGYFQVADLVSVKPSQTTSSINAELKIGGRIAGRVTDVLGNVVPGVYVQAYDLNDNTIVFNGTTTNSEGLYTIQLATGDYKVWFFPTPDSGNFQPEWYNNRSNFESADEVQAIKRNTKSKINAQLEPK